MAGTRKKFTDAASEADDADRLLRRLEGQLKLGQPVKSDDLDVLRRAKRTVSDLEDLLKKHARSATD